VDLIATHVVTGFVDKNHDYYKKIDMERKLLKVNRKIPEFWG
jgi:hypothetical protein